MGVYSGNDVDASGDAEVTLKTAAGAELLGQQTSAASLPVVIASNQSNVSVLPADTTGTGTIVALNGTVVATTRGSAAVSFNITGTWTATLTIQGTSDGSAWNTIYGVLVGTDAVTQTFASNVFLTVPCGGFQAVRLIATAFTLGTVNVAWNAGIGALYTPVFSPVAASFNATVTQAAVWNSNISQIGGASLALGQTTMASSIPIVVASNQSTLPVSVQPVTATSYSATVGPFTPGATPTDISTIIGSATKTVRVLSLELQMVQTTRANVNMYLIKRSAANTGGTSTTPTIVPMDSTNAAATAVVRQYTANPSALGASVGNFSITKVLSDDSGANAVGGAGYMWDFTKNGTAQGVVLRGVAQTFALSLNGAALPIGLVVNATWTWVEE